MAAKLAVFMAVRAILAGEMALTTGLATLQGFILTTYIAGSIGHSVLLMV